MRYNYGDLRDLEHSGMSASIVTVDDVKKHLEIEGFDHDTFINSLILEAQEEVQNALHRTLLTQTVTARYDYGRAFRLYAPPLQSVTSITSVYEGVETDEDESDFYVVNRLVPLYAMKRDKMWSASRIDEVKIVYEAGYGSASDIPYAIKQAIEQLAAAKFYYRVPREIGTIASAKLDAGDWESTLYNSGLVVPRA